jgi:hypothetical protein
MIAAMGGASGPAHHSEGVHIAWEDDAG